MKRRDDPHQLEIDWGPTPAAILVSPVAPVSRKHATGDDYPANVDPTISSPPSLVQHLPWDFRTTFPLPREDAIEAGILHETDREPENLKILHQNYANHALTILRQLDAVLDARRRGIDPGTGKRPRTHASRERLRKYLNDEPGRLRQAYNAMLGCYLDGFGEEAARALDKALKAWHAGIDVETETSNRTVPDPTPAPKSKKLRTLRPSSVMPVPRPLKSAIAAGHFGHEDNGRPVHPDPAEVRAITENHAQKIIEAAEDATRTRLLTAYAEDFGEPAAQQLERYARRRHREDRQR